MPEGISDSSKEAGQTSDLPKLGIVMPSYNQGHFIEEAIRSVLLQGYPNLEFMIFDSCSTDDTQTIICKYERWITYWISEKDRGQSHAINKGFKKATADYVSWLNSDDLLYPGALWAMADAIQKHPEAGMIYGSGAKVDESSKEIKKIPFRPYDKKLIETRFFLLQQSSFMSRKAVLDIGLVNESLVYTMDWELSIRMSRSYPIYAIDSDIGMFRIQTSGKTQTGNWTRRKEIAAVGRMCNGILDRNFIVFCLMYFLFKYKGRTGGCLDWFIRYFYHVMQRFFNAVYGEDSYMMH